MTLFVVAATLWASNSLPFRERYGFHFGSVTASILRGLCWAICRALLQFTFSSRSPVSLWKRAGGFIQPRVPFFCISWCGKHVETFLQLVRRCKLIESILIWGESWLFMLWNRVCRHLWGSCMGAFSLAAKQIWRWWLPLKTAEGFRKVLLNAVTYFSKLCGWHVFSICVWNSSPTTCIIYIKFRTCQWCVPALETVTFLAHRMVHNDGKRHPTCSRSRVRAWVARVTSKIDFV